ncbi:MAG: AAA family ATPase [Eubacterium sp.]
MNIKQAKQEIKDAVRAYLSKTPEGNYRIAPVRQRPLLLIGPPGIGKTQIMEQIARECEIGLVSYTITHHTRQSAVGLPFIRKDTFEGKEVSITEYTMSEIIASVYEKMRETGLKEGILFIDEINCVSETLAPTMLQFLQCKTFGNQAVPEGWIIVAAGNPPEYNKSVREFDMVTLDRVRQMRIDADFSVWKEYAIQRHIHPALLTYLDLRPANFYVVENDVDGRQFVTARGWEDLSSLMKVYEELGIVLTEESIREYLVHDDVAKDVAAYIDLYKKYEDHYGIPEILDGNVKTSVYERLFRASFDEKISVVHLLLSGLHGYFEKAGNWKKITDQWFAFLKQYRSQMMSGEEPVSTYQKLCKEHETEVALRKRQGFFEREEAILQEKLCNKIRSACPQIEEIHGKTPDEIFDMTRGPFAEVVEQLEEFEQTVSEKLEHAFDFAEAAFAEGQELVVFVTELAMDREAAIFLAENENERFQKYNEQLLLGTKKAELLSELREGERHAKEHVRAF